MFELVFVRYLNFLFAIKCCITAELTKIIKLRDAMHYFYYLIHIQAHRLALGSASRTLAILLSNHADGSVVRLDMTDFQLDIIAGIIKYVYTAQLSLDCGTIAEVGIRCFEFYCIICIYVLINRDAKLSFRIIANFFCYDFNASTI